MADSKLDAKYKQFDKVFDTLAGVVSLLDLITDIIILIGWYQQHRLIFFYISLGILLFAQLAYVVVFYFNHGDKDDILHSLVSIICTLPFAPFLSFIFYFVSDNDSKLRTFIDKYLLCFNFDWDGHSSSADLSPRQNWLEEKLFKHIGFLIEAIFEAFPQSILQLAAIVYYNEPNWISILSILISMTSVCSKLFLLIAAIVDYKAWKATIWLWGCFVVDFFGIFFVVSFAFYTPSNPEHTPYFLIVRDIILWEQIICVAPCVAVASIGTHIYWTLKWSEDIFFCCCYCCGVTILWAIGLFAGGLVMTVFNTFWAGFTVLYLGTATRLPYYSEPRELYDDAIEWILEGATRVTDINSETNDVIVTRSQDQIIRVCVLNKYILNEHKEYRKKE